MTPVKKKQINYEITPCISYYFKVKLCGSYCGGRFSVQAFDFDEAHEKAVYRMTSAVSRFPQGINVPFEIELNETNGHIAFESALNHKVNVEYSPDEIDIFFDEENYKILLMYHSLKNSTPVFSMNPDDLDYHPGKKGLCDYLITLANKYGCGHQNLDVLD